MNSGLFSHQSLFQVWLYLGGNRLGLKLHHCSYSQRTFFTHTLSEVCDQENARVGVIRMENYDLQCMEGKNMDP